MGSESPAKVVFLGDSGAGKTALYNAIMNKPFTPDLKPTIGAMYGSTSLRGGSGEMCPVHLWDTAGDERFRQMLPNYLNHALLALICYDVSQLTSFKSIPHWISFLRESRAGPECAVVLVGCKGDLDPDVSPDDLVACKENVKANRAMVVSAKTSDGIGQLCEEVADLLLARRRMRVEVAEASLTAAEEPAERGCC